MALNNLPFADGDAKLTQYRIDAGHSNSYEAWLKTGSPLPLSEKQFSELEAAGKLAELSPEKVEVKSGGAEMKFNLPRQGVSLLILEQPEASFIR